MQDWITKHIGTAHSNFQRSPPPSADYGDHSSAPRTKTEPVAQTRFPRSTLGGTFCEKTQGFVRFQHSTSHLREAIIAICNPCLANHSRTTSTKAANSNMKAAIPREDASLDHQPLSQLSSHSSALFTARLSSQLRSHSSALFTTQLSHISALFTAQLSSQLSSLTSQLSSQLSSLHSSALSDLSSLHSSALFTAQLPHSSALSQLSSLTAHSLNFFRIRKAELRLLNFV